MPTWNGDGHLKVGYGECSIENYVCYAVAQPRSATLTGLVVSLSGKPVEGATVEVYDYKSDTMLASDVTDSTGHYEISGLTAGKVVYQKVKAEGYYTYGSESFTLQASTNKDAILTPTNYLSGVDVLLVVDNDGKKCPTYDCVWPDEIESAIRLAGYFVKKWDEVIQGRPPLEALEDVRTVFWHIGTMYDGAISEVDSRTLIKYVSDGGRLVLEGEDLGRDHGNDTFMQKVAHANYHVDIASGKLSIVLPLDRITSGLPLNIRFEHNPQYPDGVSPIARAFEVLQYESGYSAVIGYDNATDGGSRTIYISFPVHYLSKTIRDILIANSINWVIKRPVYLVVRGMN